MLDRENVTDAIRFWERGRLFYNLALVVVSSAVLIRMGGVGVLLAMSIPLFLLAVIANLLYCVAYPIDLFIQASHFQDAWRSVRWGLLGAGTLVAVILAYVTLGGPYVFGFPGMGPHG